MPRKRETDGQPKPLISFEPPVKTEKVSHTLPVTTIGNLKMYHEYIKDSTGANPSLDEVLTKILEKYFKMDKGFQAKLQSQNGGNQNSGNQSTRTTSSPK